MEIAGKIGVLVIFITDLESGGLSWKDLVITLIIEFYFQLYFKTVVWDAKILKNSALWNLKNRVVFPYDLPFMTKVHISIDGDAEYGNSQQNSTTKKLYLVMVCILLQN